MALIEMASSLLGLPTTRERAPLVSPKALLRRRVLSALAVPGTVAEVAASTGLDPELVNLAIASLRPRLRVVEKRRVTERRGRVLVNVYVRREVGR